MRIERKVAAAYIDDYVIAPNGFQVDWHRSRVFTGNILRNAVFHLGHYAVGYRLYTGSEREFVRSISPALEVHVTTPLDTDNTGPLVCPEIVSFTGGVHVGLGLHSTLSVGCNIPVTGPRPYNAEAMVQLNYRF